MRDKGGFARFGYLRSVSQPCISIEQPSLPKQLPRIDLVDRWFRDHLEITEPLSTDPAQDEILGLEVVRRALRLYGEILRAGWIPVFASGAVRTGGSPKGEETLRLDLPVCDGFAAASFIDLYQRCLRMICEDLAQEPDPASIAAVHNHVDALIQTIRRSNPLGNSAMPMGRIAHIADIPFRHVGRGVMQFGWGRKARLMHHAMIGGDTAVGTSISRSKQLSAHLLQAAGYPAPQNALVGSLEEAERHAMTMGWPVVVKPNDLACSDGVSIDVVNKRKLAQAFALARSKSRHVLIEKQIEGVCHRVMIVGGKLAYAVRRHPKAVVGDGSSRVRELIEKADAKEARRPPWCRLKPFTIDAEVSRMLAKQRIDLDMVPMQGAIVPLRPFNSHEFGGIVEDVAATIHPDNVDLAADVARLIGLEIAGIDLMSQDVSVPWHQNGGVILEVNAGPDFMEASRKIKHECVAPVLAKGDGRIPVHLMTGEGDLRTHARTVAARLAAQGRPCIVVGENYCINEGGRTQSLAPCGLMDRALAILGRPQVNSVLLVDGGGIFLRSGFPVDRIDTVFFVAHSEGEAKAASAALTSCITFQNLEFIDGGKPGAA